MSNNNDDYDPEELLGRANFPLSVGDTIEVEGETWEFLDTPTDGPLFRIEEHDPTFDTVQLDWDEAEEMRDTLEGNQ